jgi:hypothetical protein
MISEKMYVLRHCFNKKIIGYYEVRNNNHQRNYVYVYHLLHVAGYNRPPRTQTTPTGTQLEGPQKHITNHTCPTKHKPSQYTNQQ